MIDCMEMSEARHVLRVFLMEDIERIPYRDDLPTATFDILVTGGNPLSMVKTGCLSPLLALPDPHSVGRVRLFDVNLHDNLPVARRPAMESSIEATKTTSPRQSKRSNSGTRSGESRLNASVQVNSQK